MVRRNFREKMNSKEGHQPLDDLTTKDCSLGSFSTAERINKLEKILALVNSPHNGEAMSAARMLMKLSKAWRIDLGLFRDPSGQKVETLVDGVVSSNSGHHFSPTCPEYPDPGTRPRTHSQHLSKLIRDDGMASPPFPGPTHRGHGGGPDCPPLHRLTREKRSQFYVFILESHISHIGG